MTESRQPEHYPIHAIDKLRYGDTDRQGHVNNAVFATLFETGRVELLYKSGAPLLESGGFVIARLAIDFLAELLWPGSIDIGTRVKTLGRSSITFEQALFQGERCAAAAESVVVLIDTVTRRSRPLPAEAIDYLSGFKGRYPGAKLLS